jgi:hypothetical protein
VQAGSTEEAVARGEAVIREALPGWVRLDLNFGDTMPADLLQDPASD